MNEFEKKLWEFNGRFKDLQEKENSLQAQSVAVTGEWQSFLRENGLQEKFTMTDLMLLGVRKCRD